MRDVCNVYVYVLSVSHLSLRAERVSYVINAWLPRANAHKLPWPANSLIGEPWLGQINMSALSLLCEMCLAACM